MAIVAIKGGCSVKKVAVGFQLKVAPGEYFLGGSFKYNAAGGGGPVVSDEKLSGSFRYNQSYPGCRECGNKFVYQCCHCGEFICYNGEETRGAVCPSCGQKSDVPKTKDDRIVRSCMASGAENNEIMLAIDVSGSMSSETAGVSRLAEMKVAMTTQFVSKFQGASMALIQFGPGVRTVQDFTTNNATVINAINSLTISGSTPSPLPHVINNFPDFMLGRSGKSRYLVIFTDGSWDEGYSFNEPLAKKIRDAGIKIITIGCTGADMNFLNKIATPGAVITTGGGTMIYDVPKLVDMITQK